MTPAEDTADSQVAQRILTAAEALFAEKGFAATSIREIAGSAGVTKPMVYYYYGSKDDLYGVLLDDALSSFEQLLAKALAPARGLRQQLTALVQVHQHIAQNDRARLRFYQSAISAAQPHPAAQRLAKNAYEMHAQMVRGILEEARRAREISLASAEEMAAATLVVLGTMGAFYDLGLHGANLPEACMGEPIVDILMRAVDRQ